MRLLFCALLAAMPTVSWCERPNLRYCDVGTPCSSMSQRCNLATNMCVDVGDGGACVASACAADTPVCDDVTDLCRACLPGEDARCAARGAGTPRCLGPGCVECLPPTSGSWL